MISFKKKTFIRSISNSEVATRTLRGFGQKATAFKNEETFQCLTRLLPSLLEGALAFAFVAAAAAAGAAATGPRLFGTDADADAAVVDALGAFGTEAAGTRSCIVGVCESIHASCVTLHLDVTTTTTTTTTEST